MNTIEELKELVKKWEGWTRNTIAGDYCKTDTILGMVKEAKEILSRHQSTEQGDVYWWCQNCVREVHPRQVTFEGNHETCGARVERRTDIHQNESEPLGILDI